MEFANTRCIGGRVVDGNILLECGRISTRSSTVSAGIVIRLAGIRRLLSRNIGRLETQPELCRTDSVRRQIFIAFASAGESLDDRHELVWLDGLAQVRFEASIERGLPILLARERCKRDGRNIPTELGWT